MDRRVFLQSLLASGSASVSSWAMAGPGSLRRVDMPAKSAVPLRIPRGGFIALCMHDVRDDVLGGRDKDPYAMNTRQLAALFDWMRENHWSAISVQQVLEARSGSRALPENAVLLSWDDGLESMYSKVFPLLQAYRYPGMFALETGWLTTVWRGEDAAYEDEGTARAAQQAADGQAGAPQQSANGGPRGDKIMYGRRTLGARDFVSREQIREMHASGLIEFACHTNDLHRGILSNPQGNVEPAAMVRQYLARERRYETDAEFHSRISQDLEVSSAVIEREVGVRPRAIVWPYGAVTREIEDLARKVGLPLSFGLGDGRLNVPGRSPMSFDRLILENNPAPVEVESDVADGIWPAPPIERAIQVDMDYLYDPDPEVTNRNLGKLLDRVKAMQVRTVYLQAFADPEGTGTPSALYFPNRVLPMRADLFNRVTWQLRTRAGVRVYAWLPMLAYRLPDPDLQARLSVKVRDSRTGHLRPAQRDYLRLSPFLPETARIIGGIYADLGKQCPGVTGLLIHDDAYLAEDEDATAGTADARWPGTDRPVGSRLTPRQKTQALIDFGDLVTARLRYHINLSNEFAVARICYARVVLDPAAEARFAQALEPFVAHYDQVALMAMPYLDGTREAPEEWLKTLARAVGEVPDALRKVVFELQAKNWTTNQWIDGRILRSWMHELLRLGVMNLAYYPDDFLRNRPDFRTTFEGFSLNEFPYYPMHP